MDKLKLSKSSLKILYLFLSWRIFLIVVSLLAVSFIPLAVKDRYLGGGYINYQLAPTLFSWENFDGEHYLAISIFGYKGLEQAFFPVFPMLISIFSKPISKDFISLLVNSTLIGLIISNGCFLIALHYLYDLLRIDFSEKVSFLTIVLILLFPTSFYFGSFYNESLFLLLSVLTFLNARKGNFFLASIFGAIASATRVFGIFLLPALLIEVYLQRKNKQIFWLFLIPLGLLGYMYYQYLTVGDPLAFYHLQDLVGEQRQSHFVILPQVYFRYIRMISSLSFNNPLFQTIVLEFITGIAFLILPIYGYFKKIRISYLIYVLLGFFIATIQGSFSSVPRYVLIFFPSFIALAIWINKLPRIIKYGIYSVMALGLILETSLFLRGYWVA